MKKRILSIVLALCMVLALMPQMVFAETNGSIDDFDYTISDDGKVTIDEYRNKNATEVVIPSSIEYESVAYPVTAIGNDAFKGFTSLTSINIPDSVTSIGDYAFSGCTNLARITIPETVSFIGGYAFYGTAWLASKKTESTLVVVNGILIDGKSANGKISIPDSVTSIGDYAFRNCSSITSITIPDSVTSIGDSAFYNCTGLKTITIPDSVTSIGTSTFSECTGLTSITVPDSVTSIGSQAFYDCTSLTEIEISNSLSSIENGTFSYCQNLTSITIPNSVTSIDWNAFSGCKKLATITIPETVTFIGEDAFIDTAWLSSKREANLLVVVNGILIDGNSATEEISIPNSVTSIGDSAFSACKNLTRITIPDSVTAIGRNAFNGCTGLTSITIPNSVTSIGNSAFAYCQNLEIIFLPESLDVIYAEIQGEATKVRYRLNETNGEVTITEIGLGGDKTSVDIPETVFDYPVVAVADGYQNLVGAHTHNLVNIPAKAPTYTEAGYKEHWHCTLCNKYFSDSAGTNVIDNIAVWKTGEGRINKLTVPSKTDTVSFDKDGNVTVTIEKSIVTVGGKTEVTVSESIADTIIAKFASSATKKVIINATTAKNTASKPVLSEPGTSTHINLPESAVKKLAEIENIEITFVTDNGKVVLDKETIAVVASKAGNNGQVTLVIETVEQNNNLLKIELKIKTSNGDVTDFNKGNVKVTVAIGEVLKGKKPVCVYIDEDGRYHKIGGTLNADGTFTFVTTHFSTYAVMAEEEADTVIAAQQKAEILAALADQKLAVRSKVVTMKNGKKAVRITWYDKKGEMMDFDGVEIYRSTKRNSGYGKKPIFVIKSGKSSYYNTAIKSGTRYYYRVRGFVIIEGQKYYTDYSLKAIRTVK